MNNKGQMTAVVAAAALLIGGATYVYTAPYPGNSGWQRMPGVRIGGEEATPPTDFSTLDTVSGSLIMKLDGFPPFSIYLNYVGTPEGVITATRPDGGYWAQRVRDRGGDGRLRIGNQTFPMHATEVTGDARIPLLELWSAKSRMPMDTPVGGPDPLRDWEVFVWTPR